jgi:hypothetical protein
MRIIAVFLIYFITRGISRFVVSGLWTSLSCVMSPHERLIYVCPGFGCFALTPEFSSE